MRWGLILLGIILLATKKAAAAESTNNNTGVETWIVPVNAKITSPFGYRKNPITGNYEFHNGIDLGVPEGTTIVSPMSGIVDNVYSNSLGGNQLIIKHDNGYLTGYAHLQKATVQKGDRVVQGTMIALSGKTGQVTGAHLHFTLRDPTGAELDPAPVFYPTV